MKQYLDLVRHVCKVGEVTENRTGTKTLMVPGAMMAFDISKEFPAVTTKKLAFKSVVGELCGFLRASRSAADFRALGSKVWDQNANENEVWLANPYRKGEDDVGPVYGVQWREWPGFKFVEDGPQFTSATCSGWKPVSDYIENGVSGTLMYKSIDQLRTCTDTIVNNPDSRRILFHGWNPAVLDEVALPACHVLYQFMPNRKSGMLHLNVYLRSNDLGLGAPFNIASAAALQSLVGRLTGYQPKLLNIMIGDAHVYLDHLPMLREQLARTPFDAPTLKINDRVPEFHRDGYCPEWLNLIEPSDFTLENYQHHPAIKAPMAV